MGNDFLTECKFPYTAEHKGQWYKLCIVSDGTHYYTSGKSFHFNVDHENNNWYIVSDDEFTIIDCKMCLNVTTDINTTYGVLGCREYMSYVTLPNPHAVNYIDVYIYSCKRDKHV